MINQALLLHRFRTHYPVLIEMSLKDCLHYLYTDQQLSIHDIAALTSGEAAPDTIRRLLQKLNIPLRNRGGANYKGRQARLFTKKEYLTLSTDALCEKYGKSAEAIRRMARQYGYPRKGR